MLNNETKGLGLKREYIWILALTLFFVINLNLDWNSSRLVWYGCIALLLIAYLIAFNGKVLLKVSPYFGWIISFMALGLISLLWCLNVSIVIDVMKSFVIWIAILLCIQFSLDMGFNIDVILKAYLVATLINAVYLLLSIDIATIGEIQLGAQTLDGWNSNGIGFMIAQGAMVGCYLLDKSKRKMEKLILLVCIISLTVITMLTGSRTAFIMLIAEFILYICLRYPTKIVRNLIIIACVLVFSFYLIMNVEIFYNVLGVRFEGLFALFTGKGEVDSSASMRDTFIQNGIKWFKENPILGYGLNNYKALNLDATGRFTYAHNTFIELAVDLGVIGLVWYYAVYVYLAIAIFKNIDNKPLKAFLLSALVASLISQYGTVSYYKFYQNFLLFLCFYFVNRFKKKGVRY